MDFLNQLKNVIDKRRPFVAYKFPNQIACQLQVQDNDNLIYKSDLDQAGFVFAPFDKAENTILFPFSQGKTVDFKVALQPSKDVKEQTHNVQQSTLEQQDYQNLITKAITKIKNKTFNKVVLSRRISLKITSLDSGQLFVDLISHYPNAFCYLWYHPKVGMWAGATPEKLIEIQGQSFSTMALAGTQIYNNEQPIIWGKKEQQEQQWVVDFIVKALKNNKIPYSLSKPYSLKAGHLTHICTEIKGELPKYFILKKLIDSLHPTPAVAGLPRVCAIDFIKNNESYNREFYTGFLGLIQSQSSRLFVNLRCMQIKKDKVLVYVGGGITADSHPLSEWNETKAKSKTMLELLNY